MINKLEEEGKEDALARPTVLQHLLIGLVLLLRVVQCVGQSVTATGPHAYLQANLGTHGQKRRLQSDTFSIAFLGASSSLYYSIATLQLTTYFALSDICGVFHKAGFIT